MGLSDLARFINPTDAKRALKNPSKAFRIVYRSLAGKDTTHIEEVSGFTEDQVVAMETLFKCEEGDIDEILAKVRNGPVHHRVQACKREIESKPYHLGGMNLGGEIAYLVTRLLNPDSVLEVGVANGVSTAYILGALDAIDSESDIRAIDKPQFVSDIREQRGERGLRNVGGLIPDHKTAAWVAPRNQRAAYGYQYYVGDFRQALPGIVNDLEPLDLAIYDATKDASEMEMAYRTILDSLVTGGVLISDDISVNNVFEEVTSEYPGKALRVGGCGIYRHPVDQK